MVILASNICWSFLLKEWIEKRPTIEITKIGIIWHSWMFLYVSCDSIMSLNLFIGILFIYINIWMNLLLKQHKNVDEENKWVDCILHSSEYAANEKSNE